MAKIRTAFKKIDGVTPNGIRKGKIRPGYEHVNVHMIFDIKMDETFTRNVRLVADGHTTAPTSSIVSLSVVSRERVSIAFLLESLNELEKLA